MASESRSTTANLAAVLIAVLLLAVILVIATVTWLGATESGTRAAFVMLRLAFAGKLETSGVEGRLIGPLRIGQFTLHQADQNLQVSDINLLWRPRALSTGLLDINLLRIGELRIDLLAAKDKPAVLPASLRLPMQLQIAQIKIAHIRVRKQGKEILEAEDFSGALKFDGQRYRADVNNLRTTTIGGKLVSGKLAGSMNLAADAPYALNAGISIKDIAQAGDKGLQADGTLQMQGELAALDAQFNLQLRQGKSVMAASGKLALQAFSLSVIRHAELDACDINLALLDPSWPLTRISLSASLEQQGKGIIAIKNAEAGPLDKHRLPISQADLHVRLIEGGIKISEFFINGGVLQGSGDLTEESAELKLDVHALNLKQIDTRLRETRLTGLVAVKKRKNQDSNIRLSLSEPWQRTPLKLDAEAAINEKHAVISAARLQRGKAGASLTASIDFIGERRFAAEGKFTRLHLQDFGQFPGWPDITLNGHIEASGKNTAKPEANIIFSITESLIDGHALQGDGKLLLRERLNAQQLEIPHLQLSLGVNQLTAQGTLNEKSGNLQFSLQAPQLSQLGRNFGGSLRLEGHASGSIKAPLLSMNGQAQHLVLPGAISVETLQLQLQAGTQANAPFELQLDSRNIASGSLRAEIFKLQSVGTLARHQLIANLTTGKQNLAMDARGGLVDVKEGKAWQGLLTKAATSGNFSAHMEKSATLFLSSQRQQIEALTIVSDYGQLILQSFRRNATGMASHGTITQLQPAALLALTGQRVVQSGDLKLNGEWDMDLSSDRQTPWQGKLSLQRTMGDLVLRDKQPIALGLQSLAMTLSAKDNRIQAAIKAEGRQLGLLSFAGSASTAIKHSLLPDPRAPLSAELNVQLPAIGWIAALLSPDLIAQGSINSEVSISGSLSVPRLKGHIRGQQLRLMLIDSGIDLKNGVLDGEFTENKLDIRQLQFTGSSGNGTISVTGPLTFQDNKLAAKLDWRANRFAVFDRTDRKLVTSGDGKFSLIDALAALNGNILVDSGFFDIGREGAPQLSDDVIVAGQAPAGSRKLALDMDLIVGLGEQLVIRGRGIDAHVGGAVELASQAGSTLTARGLLQVTRGTYKAYGRELAIERGILRFDGAPGNPALDIKAMRRGAEVQAGVTVGGTALAPRVALVSEPQVPDAEKLSWLVLGQGLSTASGNDLGALQGAAAALLSQGAAAGVQAQLATTFGLDSISLSNRQGTLQERIITLGKRVSSRLYVSYQQGLQTAGSAVLLRYTLSPRLTVEAETGVRSVFSLFYNMRFD